MNGHFNVNFEEKECHKIGECNIDFFDGNDPFEHDNDPIPTDTESEKSESSEKKEKVLLKDLKYLKCLEKIIIILYGINLFFL